MYLFGTNLPIKKRIDVSLTYCYGFGSISRDRFLAKLGYNLYNKVSVLERFSMKSQEFFIPLLIKSKVKKRVGVFFRQKIIRHITKIKREKTLRALRHFFCLPVRGQRTRKNAQTQKSKRINRKKIAVPKKKKK